LIPEADVVDNRVGAATLHFDGVDRHFSSPTGEVFTAVQGIDLRIEPGQFVTIIGPSGCGKSTLLNLGAGLLGPTNGTVYYQGKPIKAVNTDVGYMMQQDHLLPWRTVERNVMLPLEIQKLPRREARQRAAAMIERVGLSGFASYYPSQLSGGMRKRVALARTLVYSPSTLMMDEPFAALDAQLRLVMQRQLLSLWQAERKTVLFVTHDLEEAILLGDLVIVFGTNPGRIIHTERVPLDRPRELVEVKRDPHFVDMWERLWRLIEEQISG
jgi:NitT/TauT family transport system ATP-binding protein